MMQSMFSHYAVEGHSWSPLLGSVDTHCSLVSNTNLHPISHRFQDIVSIGQIFGYRQGMPAFNAVCGHWTSKFTITRCALRNGRHRFMVWCKAYFDILNHLCVTHEFDRQMYGQIFSQQMSWLTMMCGKKTKTKIGANFLLIPLIYLRYHR